VNVSPERLDDELARALDQICQLFGADQCGLLRVLRDRRQLYFEHINHVEESQREFFNSDLAPFHPWAYRRLVEEEEAIIFSSLAELPPEAGADRAAWEKVGVQALLLLPLKVGGQVANLIGLSSRNTGHKWPPAYIRRLRLLGEMFAKALMNRTVHEDMLRNGRALLEAQRIAHLGIWEWDLGTGGLKWSDEVYRIFGVLPGEFGATYEAFLASVHPDDRAAVDQAVKEALADAKKGYDIEHRVISPDGAQRVVHARGEVTFDPDRKPVRMFGTVHDITERKHTERSLEWAFEEIKSLREKLEAEIVYLREEIQFEERFEGIVGVSDPIKNVMRRIQQVADTATTVLLTGETGTGKGVFARALHEASRRRDKRFV